MLGVRFIWIDSLCIIQDDPDDWNQEALRMASYYQNAWLTIFMMSTANDPFRSTDKDVLPDIDARLPYRNKDGQLCGYFYLKEFYTRSAVDGFSDVLKNSGLLRRGWVFQEWNLSRRRLVISSKAGYIDCCSSAPRTIEGVELECEEIGDPTSGETILLSPELFSPQMGEFRTILQSWQEVVGHFSSLHISFIEQDRLLALSGLAQEFATALQKAPCRLLSQDVAAKYTGGMWMYDLSSLLWVQVDTNTRSRKRIRGISTWSWASMATDMGTGYGLGLEVGWDEAPKAEVVCQLLDITAVPVCGKSWEPMFDQAGQYSPGNRMGNENRFSILTLQGRLLQVDIHDDFNDTDDTSLAAAVTFQTEEERRVLWRPVTHITNPELIRGWASLEHPHFADGEVPASGVRLSAFVILKSTGTGGMALGNWFSSKIPVYHVLFLRPEQVPGYEAYERIGVGRLYGYEFQKEYQQAEETTVHLV